VRARGSVGEVGGGLLGALVLGREGRLVDIVEGEMLFVGGCAGERMD